jgi:thiamine transport system ATP-binding protein
VQIRSIQRDLDITTIYVTHDQAEALAISDRLAVVRDGRIEQVGTPEQVYREPGTRFVAEFVGDNNVFDGVVTEAGDRIAVDGTATLPLPNGTDLTAGASATVSVRPEAISVHDGDGQHPDGNGSTVGGREAGTVTRSAAVETVEYLGDAYRVHCRWNDQPVTVKTDSTSPPEGTVSLGFHPDAVHVLSNGARATATGGDR